MEQKTTGTAITQISLASQMVYPPASRLVTNSGVGNAKDKAKLKTSIRMALYFKKHETSL